MIIMIKNIFDKISQFIKALRAFLWDMLGAPVDAQDFETPEGEMVTIFAGASLEIDPEDFRHRMPVECLRIINKWLIDNPGHKVTYTEAEGLKIVEDVASDNDSYQKHKG